MGALRLNFQDKCGKGYISIDIDICMAKEKICKKHGLQPISKYYYSKTEKRFRCKLCVRKVVKTYEKKNKKKTIERFRRYRAEQRMKALQHYSGSDVPFCACCNEKFIEFLVLDHKNGDGAEHRREVGHHSMYQWAIKNNYPPMFRVLCFNCNNSFGIYGRCPHQTL